MAEVRLQHPPLDAISQIRFAPIAGSGLLLVSSWDAHVRLYDAASNRLMGMKKHNKAILDCTFVQDTSRFLSVGLDARLVACDFQTGQEFVIGHHDAAIRCVEFHQPTMQVFTGSWDRTLRAWDPRQAQRPVKHVSLGTKVFCMDTCNDKVVVGGADRNIHIYDIRNMAKPVDRRECSLKHQLRSIKVSPDQTAYAAGSVEGRVALEYMDAQENLRSRYAFKCHRTKDGAEEVIHPVNALAFNPKHGTFATGGSDGVVCIWDGYAKKRLWKTDPFGTSISALSFSADGSQMAIGVSYTFDDGEKYPCPTNELIIRAVTDKEMEPKVQKEG
mmetsp:Transcript_47252/g.119672  ORF Transcript_47252/g.119672 Transcript_47252/m.119672 type:complete len:330 (+) Transcript_47252:80-1069(+)|eukprot:CAMPEP_0183559588 /NCGR_PEP_ID=MMETSP0371-20130417/92222_1 /TAXON_ID=268820 /ORGANISM="Peridinium aciculiferum, Strain PAER-2" /LENGTH=329 /DNA_ID=CAMNT_0025767467 /DNA_START=74 /DNA_END=1063 /DNA_ORIENTATION=-